jgi:hypothetical protein
LDPAPLAFEYNRFYLFGVDGATDLGPVQLGVEATYMLGRTLTSVARDACEGVDFESRCLARPDRSDVAQLALRGELLEGEGFVLVLEAFGARAMGTPTLAEQRFAVVDEHGLLYGAGGGLRWSPGPDGLKLELGGAALNGPTLVAVPRVEYELVPRLFAELGAAIVEGRRRPPELLDQSLGYLYRNVSQVFTGLRFVP